MSEPLNDFLEEVESYLSDPYATDEEVGARIRTAWENMKEAEKMESATGHTVPDYKGDPIRVTVPTSNLGTKSENNKA